MGLEIKGKEERVGSVCIYIFCIAGFCMKLCAMFITAGFDSREFKSSPARGLLCAKNRKQ